MKRTEFCKHYRAMAYNETCEKGVAYATFKGLPFDQCPCFERGGVAPKGCELAEFPTADERAAKEAKMKLLIENIGKARAAIVASLGGPWKRGTPGGSGAIDCPVCGSEKSLRFSRAGSNGHIHASCKTEGCVLWME